MKPSENFEPGRAEIPPNSLRSNRRPGMIQKIRQGVLASVTALLVSMGTNVRSWENPTHRMEGAEMASLFVPAFRTGTERPNAPELALLSAPTWKNLSNSARPEATADAKEPGRTPTVRERFFTAVGFTLGFAFGIALSAFRRINWRGWKEGSVPPDSEPLGESGNLSEGENGTQMPVVGASATPVVRIPTTPRPWRIIDRRPLKAFFPPITKEPVPAVGTVRGLNSMKRLPSPERPDSSECFLSSERPTSPERPPLVDATEKAKNRLENYRTFARVARMKGFQVPAESDVVSDESLVGSVTMRLPTVRGQFALTFFQNRDESGWKTAWIENGTKRFERTWVRKDAKTGMFSQNDLERHFSSRIDQCVLSAMVARERAKQQDFREIEKVEVGSSDLKAIYRRLEEPWVRNSGNETGGFWFASPYLTHSGTFPLRNLELPLKEQESATPVSHEIWDLSFFQNAYRKRMLSDFSDYERSLALKFAKRAKVTESGHPLLGFCRTFNWHKHPGAPLSPSDGDLNHPGAEPSTMYSGTALATFYAIANRVGQNDAVRSWSNALTFPHEKYGGTSDYVITFWKVLKILPEERKRREAAIEKIGRIRGISLGLCETDGKLKHLSTCAEVPGVGTFWPDMLPIVPTVSTAPIVSGG